MIPKPTVFYITANTPPPKIYRTVEGYKQTKVTNIQYFSFPVIVESFLTFLETLSYT